LKTSGLANQIRVTLAMLKCLKPQKRIFVTFEQTAKNA